MGIRCTSSLDHDVDAIHFFQLKRAFKVSRLLQRTENNNHYITNVQNVKSTQISNVIITASMTYK